MTGKIKQFLWAMRPQHPFPRVSEEDDATYIARYTIHMEELAAKCIDDMNVDSFDENVEDVRNQLTILLESAGRLDFSENMCDSICRNAMRLVRWRLISEVLGALPPKSEGIQGPPTPAQLLPGEGTARLTVISSTEGLANFLGCGKTKAFEIIKSGILKEAGIQYRVGKSWKFNAEKLEKYITEHPEFLK